LKTITLTIIICLILFSAPSICQLQIGAKGGINIAKYIHQETESWTTTLNGVVVGGIGRYTLSDIFSLQLEANYIQKGFTIPDLLYERSNYLEFPIGLIIKFMNSDFRPYIYVGGGIGLVLNVETDWTDIPSGTPGGLGIIEYYRSSDITAQFGTGLEYFIVPSLSIILDARYTPGIFTITRQNWHPILWTSGIQVQLGIMKSIN